MFGNGFGGIGGVAGLISCFGKVVGRGGTGIGIVIGGFEPLDWLRAGKLTTGGIAAVISFISLPASVLFGTGGAILLTLGLLNSPSGFPSGVRSSE